MKSNRDGLVAVYLVCTLNLPILLLRVIAFDDIVMGDCILNSNTNELKARVE